MKQKAPLLCFALGLFFSFAPICLCAQNNSKGWHDRDTRRLWKKSGTKKFCDPSVSDQTAAGVVPECSPGFYRERTGPSKGRCVPCRCNGLSDLCDAQTGSCTNCRFDAAGDRCDRCREGFHGHAANRTCRACPCPSTHNNFAVACLDISPGVVECLCKRGYSGARCERCAFGYYGNPMVPGDICKPCSCTDGSLSGCDSLTGECATGANGGDPCHGCDGCACALLVDLEKEDSGLALLRQLVLNITAGLPELSLLEADALQTKLRVDGYSGAVRWVEPNVEQLEADIALVGNDLTRQNNEMPDITLDLEKTLKNVNRTVIQVQDLLFEAVALIQAANGLAERQASVEPDVSGSVSDGQKSQMMEEAEQIMAEIKDRRCTIQGAGADGEQEGARMLLENIRADIGDLSQTVQAVLKPTADVLTASTVSVTAVAEQLLSVQETVEKTQRLNLKGATGLENLQTALAALRRERSWLPPAMERIYDTMKKTKDALFMSQKIKKEEESLAAQVDGGKLELFGKLNATWKCATQTDAVTRAEEHAEELGAAAAELRQVLQNVANSRELLRIFGAHDGVARLSQAANQALRDVKEGGLIISAEEMEDVSADLHAEANDTRRCFKTVSRALNAQRDGVKKQEKKAEMLKASVLSVGGIIRQIERDDTKDLVEFVKITTSAVNAEVSKVKERLGNISLEVRRIPSASFSGNFLTDANRAVKRLNRAMPVLEDKLEQMKALGANTSPSANVTESIERIKDIIDETRSFVNRLSLATTFNGKSYIELHPPRNLEDIKAFTAVDLLLSLHHGDAIAARRRRRRQRHKHRDENSHFVLYLGNRDTFGDYFAMVVRNTKLICLYKLGGVIHEMETSRISTGNTSSSYFDRIVFQRVYQDATVSITKNFTSQKPISLPPKQNLPNTTSGVMSLDSQRAVFYVGGYPEEFNPPEELQYPKYRGAMKLSYINDVPVNLFNYKRAVNMQTKQRTAKIPQTELCDYYDGTGYRMAFLKEPQKEKRRLFRFNTSSRETNALLFYIGTEESFFCVCVERGFLVLEGQQGSRQLRNQSSAQVSLFEKKFAVMIADRFVVRYGSEQIHTDHIQTNYTRWYMGGLPAWLRRRHNITAAPLRGCVDHVTADAEIVEYDKTVGVGGGCPVSLLGVRAAAVFSALPADSLFVCNRQSRVSLGFSSTSRHAVLLNCGSQSFTSGHDLQLSLADGFIIFRRYNYTLTSGKRYNDGAWHYLSAEGRPTGLVLSIDNVNAIQKQEPPITRPEEKFKGCIANFYARRNDSKFIPADLSSLSHAADVFPGWCSLKFQSLAGAHCSQQAQYEHQFSEASWLSYTFPEEELNYRPHFSLHIKTNSSKGLILHVAGRGVVPRLALYMANGKIRMSLGQDRVIQHRKKSNDGGWHMVEFSVENSTFHLLVDGVRVPDGQLPGNEGSSLQLRSPVYLGGHPERKTTKGHDIPADGVIGCLRDFKMNNVAAPAPDSSREILPCSGGLTETGTFFGGGHVLLDNFFTGGSRFVLSFEMRPQHLTGLLFHFRSDSTSSLNVYLMENGVGVGLNDATGPVSVTVAPRESLCDGKFHAVTVSRQRSVIELAVDSESKQETHSSTSDTSYSTLYIGGTAHQHGVPVPSPFVGCLRHLKINGKPLGLETESEVVGVVSMNRCPAG